MLWVVAIASMVLGAALAFVQNDVKRMLAYSSVAHTGFLLVGVLGVQSAGDLADGQYTSLEGVLFHLTTYGFATVAAFAMLTLVRDAGGEATHDDRWAGWASGRRWSPGRSPSSCSRWPASRSRRASSASGRSSPRPCRPAPGRSC